MPGILILIALVAPCAGKPQPIKGDPAEIVGTWECVQRRFQGEDGPPLEDPRTIFTKDEMKVADRYPFRYKTDSSKNPKQIDIAEQDGGEAGIYLPGIYKIEGDTMTICMGFPSPDDRSRERPETFSGEKGKNSFLEVFKRAKKLAAPGDDKPQPSKGDPAAIVGTWECVQRRFEGEDGPPLEDPRTAFTKDEMRVPNRFPFRTEGPDRFPFAYKTNPSKEPKWIDVAEQDGRESGIYYPGIYKVEGDTMTICMGFPSPDDGSVVRPEKFSGEKGEHSLLWVFKWVKKSVAPRAEIVGLVLAPGPQLEPAQPINRDPAAIVGAWECVQMRYKGEDRPPLKDPRTTFTKDEMKVAGWPPHRYTTDSSVDPNLINIAEQDGGGAGIDRPGIYQVQGDTLTICIGLPDRDESILRPGDFSSEKGEPSLLMVYKRVKK